jgi:hypothetical protein
MKQSFVMDKPIRQQPDLLFHLWGISRACKRGLNIAAPVVLGIGLGIAVLMLPPLVILVVLVGGAGVLATLKRPELAIITMLVLTSSIVFEETLPLLNLGFGSLHIPDLILLALLGMLVLRWIVERDFTLHRSPLDAPLLAFYGVTLLATCRAIFAGEVEFNIAFRAIRTISYYLVFFLVTNLLREECQLRWLLNGMFWIATVVAGAVMLQFVMGNDNPILPGRVETLITQGASFDGIARILPPGQSLLLVGFIALATTLCLRLINATNLLRLIQVSLLGLAVIMTFLRCFWAIVATSFLLLILLVRGQDLHRMVYWAVVLVVPVLMILLLITVQPDSKAGELLQAVLDRFDSFTGKHVTEDQSLLARGPEYEYAIPQIFAHPLLGLGGGARYRPYDVRLDGDWWDGRAYIHNGHLWLILQSGLLGYGCFVWLTARYLLVSFRNWRRISHPYYRGIILSFALVYLGGLFGSIVAPMYMQWFWAPVFGIMMGVSMTALRLNDEPGGLPAADFGG